MSMNILDNRDYELIINFLIDLEFVNNTSLDIINCYEDLLTMNFISVNSYYHRNKYEDNSTARISDYVLSFLPIHNNKKIFTKFNMKQKIKKEIHESYHNSANKNFVFVRNVFENYHYNTDDNLYQQVNDKYGLDSARKSYSDLLNEALAEYNKEKGLELKFSGKVY